MATTINGTTGIVTETGTGDVSVGDDLIFTGTGNRITGDFSNATESNRVGIQSSTTNGATAVSLIPNGTSTFSGLILNNSSDVANSSQLYLQANGSSYAAVLSGKTGTGSYLPLAMFTGGAERLRIDTSGNVGIGSTNPSAFSPSTTYANTVAVTKTDQAISIGSYYQAGVDAYAFIKASEIGNPATATQLRFYGGTSERMRIDSSGNLLVGTTATFDNVSFLRQQVLGGIATKIEGTGDASQMSFFNNNGRVGYIGTSGTTTSYATSSDYRLKEQVTPMTGALAKNELLNPVTYKWKSTGDDGQGFIAHELQAVFPDAVTGEKDAVDADGNPVYQGVDTSFLVGHLVACVKELKSELDSVKAELATLKGAA